jgi:Tfp pilus assembly protein PilF
MKLGWFLLGTGRPAKAENTFRTALEADPFLLEAWVGLVRSLDAAGEKSKADELIKEMGRTDPTLADGVIRSREGGSSQSENK